MERFHEKGNALRTADLTTIIFDYGNTLIPFGPEQFRRERRALEATLVDLFGHCDMAKVKAIRDRQIVAPYQNGWRENDMRDITREMLRELYGTEATPSEIDAVLETRYRVFMETAALADGTMETLVALRGRKRLALLSNYPSSRAIRDSLEALGIAGFFEAIVVSGEIGFVKPHPLPFETILRDLRESAENAVYIGDNWLADVQGARRAGMQSILTTEFQPYESFPERPGDLQPQARISRLSEIVPLLGL